VIVDSHLLFSIEVLSLELDRPDPESSKFPSSRVRNPNAAIRTTAYVTVSQ